MGGLGSTFARLGVLAGALALILGGTGVSTAAERDAADTATALHCGNLSASRGPVLLIHGTGATAAENWSWGYQPALTKAGFGVCTIDLPERGKLDVQVSADHVVQAIRSIYDATGRKVSVVGHSQGGLHPVWVTRFFPDLRHKVDDSIGLAAPYSGTLTAELDCPDGSASCSETTWQFQPDSNFLAALQRDPLPSGPSYTSIGSRTDEIVLPAPQATRLPGAVNIMVQDVCPARPVDHYTIAGDGAVYELVLDALTHAGPANPRRLSLLACTKPFVPGVDLATLLQVLPTLVQGQLTSGRQSAQEPPLRCYAQEDPQACGSN